MANIIILTNKDKYPYHSLLAPHLEAYLQQEHAVSILDIDSKKQDYLVVNRIKSMEPDILITLDLSGFRFRTQSGECALNLLFSKNMNLIWGQKPEYHEWLSGKLSLSMLFYDATGQNCYLPEAYPNMQYYYTHEDYQITLGTADGNVTALPKMFAHFLSQISPAVCSIPDNRSS